LFDKEAGVGQVCAELAERFGARGGDKTQEGFWKMAAPVRMSDGLTEGDTISKSEEIQAPPQISERDLAKIERRRRKEERQRQVICHFVM
jgi:ATP-binding cassette subfamily F protein 3